MPKKYCWFSAAGGAILAALALGPAVWCHRTPWAKVTALTVSETGLRARVDYAITDRQLALDLRERFDRNADRRLSPEEQEHLKAYLVSEARRPLRVTWNGVELSLERTAVTASGLDDRLPSSYPITLTVHLQTQLKIDRQFNTIRISDFDARVLRESICSVTFPKAFRWNVERRPEVVVAGDTIWRVFTGEGQELIINFQR